MSQFLNNLQNKSESSRWWIAVIFALGMTLLIVFFWRTFSSYNEPTLIIDRAPQHASDDRETIESVSDLADSIRFLGEQIQESRTIQPAASTTEISGEDAESSLTNESTSTEETL